MKPLSRPCIDGAYLPNKKKPPPAERACGVGCVVVSMVDDSFVRAHRDARVSSLPPLLQHSAAVATSTAQSSKRGLPALWMVSAHWLCLAWTMLVGIWGLAYRLVRGQRLLSGQCWTAA